MVKISSIFALGILVVLIPFSGFPNNGQFGFKNCIYILSGALIAVLSLLIRRELHEVLRQLHSEGIETETFSESAPKQEVQENK